MVVISQESLPILHLWDELWTGLKHPFTVTLIRIVGTISSVVAATIAIFIDAEGVKKRASSDSGIRLAKLGQEAWRDRFVRQVFVFIVAANLISLFGDYLKDRATDDTNDQTSAKIVGKIEDATKVETGAVNSAATKSKTEITKAINSASAAVDSATAAIDLATRQSKNEIETAINSSTVTSTGSITAALNSATQITQAQQKEIASDVINSALNAKTQQQEIADNALAAINSIQKSQYSFYDVRIDLARRWYSFKSRPYPKICAFLDQEGFSRMRKSSGSQPSVISSIDPSIAPLVTGNSEFLDDYLNVSSLSSLEVSAWIGNNDAEGRTRDEIGRENLQYPVFYSTKVPGAIEWDTRSEIYFTSEAMPGMSTCLEHISLFFEASSSNFPDRTILDLVGKKLFLAVDSSVVTYEYDLNEKAFPTDRKRVPLPLEVTDIFLGDYKMDLEYPDKVGYRSPVAKLRNGERDGLYEFQFPDIKSLIALFNYRPYKRPSSFSPDL